MSYRFITKKITEDENLTTKEKIEALSDSEIIAIISDEVINTDTPLTESEEIKFFKDINQLDLEIGSAASIEQYFRWAEPTNIKNIISQLKEIDLNELAITMQEAIDIAFPNGIPNEQKNKSNLTDWTPEQEEKLKSLYEAKFHDQIESQLSKYAREKQILESGRFNGKF